MFEDPVPNDVILADCGSFVFSYLSGTEEPPNMRAIPAYYAQNSIQYFGRGVVCQNKLSIVQTYVSWRVG